jgi:chaperonin cofactor prefoldin
MLEQSTSNSSRGREDLEPLQKRLKTIEDHQDQLLSTVEELLKQVRKAPASPIRPSLLPI